MKAVALLDVNLLVALFYDQHAQHELAHDWFEDHKSLGWATCPITENGVVRMLSNRNYIAEPWRPTMAIERLREFRESGHHRFWTESVSLTDDALFNRSVIQGHKQITDIYLLGLAKSAGGSLATFDQSIPLGAVRGATKANLQVISAAPAEPTSEDS